jgi:peptidoglycan/LPS O-acetylase OafA/YrhL
VLFGFALGVWLRHGSGGVFAAPARALARGGAIAVYVAAALALAAPLSFHGLYVAMVIAVAAPIIVLAGASISTVAGRSAALARRLGALSYPLYCLHFPIGRVVWALGERNGVSPPACMGAGLVLSLIAAQIALVAFDAPVRRILTGALGLGAETRADTAARG